MARPWPVPAGDTIQLVGDLHFGLTSTLASQRADKVLKDTQGSRMLPAVAARVMIGDFIQDVATAAADQPAANAWCNSMGGTWYGVVGNHDISDYTSGGNGDVVRGGDASMAACTSWVPSTANWTADLGFVQLIGVDITGVTSFPTAAGSGATPSNFLQLLSTARSFLDSTLAAATKDCAVLCHGPLDNSVTSPGGDDANYYTTTVPGPDPGMSVDPIASILTILNARSRAKFFISGHTHSLFEAPGFIIPNYNVGSRNIVTINCGGIAYNGTGKVHPHDYYFDPIKSLFMTFPGNGTAEVRVRDHGRGVWGAINGTKVTTVTIPA